MIQIALRSCTLITVVLTSMVLGVGSASAGQWQWPLAGRPAVVRGFDPPATPYGSGHRGVDLAGHPGVEVRAAGAGRVGYAGQLAGRGVVTVLHTGGLRTTYEPLVVLVRAGAPVVAGAVLGRLAPRHPGCPQVACLHWGLLRGETYLDPLALLGIRRVRLFPLDGAGPQGATPAERAAAVTAAAVLPVLPALLWRGVRGAFGGRRRRRRNAIRRVSIERSEMTTSVARPFLRGVG